MRTRLSFCGRLHVFRLVTALALTCLGSPLSGLHAQSKISYNDVALIVNDMSDSSKAIGAYFAQKRNIPSRNIIHISVPAQEQIDSQTFESLRTQVEAYLLTHNMKDTINYLVTTKGMPLACYRSGSNAASVESDLMLILGRDSGAIGKDYWIEQQYFDSLEHFSHKKYGFYLVTRLDGYTNADIFRMIDHSGPNIVVNQTKAKFIMDEDPTPIDPGYNQVMAIVDPVLRSRGWTTILDTTTVYLTKQQNVIGYVSWGSNDHHASQYSIHANPMNTWLPGWIGETYVSTGARSFQPGTGYGQSLIADWIQEGISGIKGYVYEPYTTALAQVQILFDRYTDNTQDSAFNMAESYVMASPLASWMDVLIGDPKMSIITKLPPKPTPSVGPAQTICLGTTIELTGSDTVHSAHNWFKGSALQIMSLGPPYDEHNPNWIASGPRCKLTPKTPGTLIYAYCDENISGVGFGEVKVTTLPRPIGNISLSGDSLRLGDVVPFGVSNTNATSFVWDFGDQTPFDSSQSPTHRFFKVGTFDVRLILSNGGCDTTVTRTIVVLPASSVLRGNSFANFELAPNPTHGIFHFSFETPEQVSAVYRIVDATGRVIQSGSTPVGTRHEQTVSLPHVSSGTYFLEVFAGGRSSREKIVVE